MGCNTEELRLDARKEEDLLSCPPPIHWVPGDVTVGKAARLEVTRYFHVVLRSRKSGDIHLFFPLILYGMHG